MKKNDERDERKTRKVLVPLATLAVATAVAVGSGATWTSTTSSAVSVKAGSIIHSNTRDGMTLTVTGLLPGKTATGEVDIKNTGDLDALLTLQRTGATNSLGSDLTMTITQTDGAGATFATGTFPSTTDIPGITLDDTFAKDEVHTYQFAITLDGNAPEADQGKTAAATYVFKTVPKNGSASPVANWVSGLPLIP